MRETKGGSDEGRTRRWSCLAQLTQREVDGREKWIWKMSADRILLRQWGISCPLVLHLYSISLSVHRPLKSNRPPLSPPALHPITSVDVCMCPSFLFCSPSPSALLPSAKCQFVAAGSPFKKTSSTGDDSRAFRLRSNQKVFSPAQSQAAGGQILHH